MKRYNIAADTLAGVVEHPEGSFIHWRDAEQLRGNLSLAEEGLANATQEIERLKRDIQELTCGDPRLVCPNCRPAQIRQLCPECLGYMPCALHPGGDPDG